MVKKILLQDLMNILVSEEDALCDSPIKIKKCKDRCFYYECIPLIPRRGFNRKRCVV